MAARHGTISPTLRAGVPFLGGQGGEGGLAVVVQFFKVVFQPPFWGGTHLGTVAILLCAYRAA